MNDTTIYSDKLPPSLNTVLSAFTGNRCVMVRKIKNIDKIKNKPGNCHINVKAYVEKFGGSSISGWILNRIPSLNDKGLFVWSFHSIWQKPDGKWLDVTEDKHYIGRDKSIFIPDSLRTPDLIEGTSYNNFVVFTEPKFAAHYSKSIGIHLLVNKVYWTDSTLLLMVDTEQHSGLYRLIHPDYPDNLKKMCDEYELEIINGKPKPKSGSKYSESKNIPIEMIFDYSIVAKF